MTDKRQDKDMRDWVNANDEALKDRKKVRVNEKIIYEEIPMREIKFRAWDKESKEMIYLTDGMKTDNYAFIVTADSYFIEFDNSEDDKMYWGKSRILPMQYTGLKDKNGKEIYEGDIISIPKEPNAQVMFSKGCFIGKEINGWDVMADYFPLGVNKPEMFEIIGNIYENPELLRKED